MMIFTQRSAKLFNGQTVHPGDQVSFLDSDGIERVGVIEYDVNNPKRLFFWNNKHEIKDYKTAKKV